MCYYNYNFHIFIFLNSPYLNWDYNNPEYAVLGVAFQSFEWLFVRTAPIIFIISIIGIILTRKERLKLFLAKITNL